LEALVQMDQMEIDKASALYAQYLNDIPFL
jgi:hypothetical protein